MKNTIKIKIGNKILEFTKNELKELNRQAALIRENKKELLEILKELDCEKIKTERLNILTERNTEIRMSEVDIFISNLEYQMNNPQSDDDFQSFSTSTNLALNFTIEHAIQFHKKNKAIDKEIINQLASSDTMRYIQTLVIDALYKPQSCVA